MKFLLAAAFAVGMTSTGFAENFDPVVKIGVLSDFSSVYKDNTGDGSYAAAQLAIDDFLAQNPKTVLKPVLLRGDHQNKPDLGLSMAREWFDQHVDVITDLSNSAIALGVSGLAAQYNKVALATSAGSTDLSGKDCNANTLQWGFDTYTNTSVARSLTESGLKSWFFITADYTYGQSLEKNARKFVVDAGGKVLGNVRHPLGAQDYSSYLLTAQSSGAQVIGFADGANDFVNAMKQATEFGLTKAQTVAGMAVEVNDLRALGPQIAQGLIFAGPFYWDANEHTRAWTKRFIARNQGRYPTGHHASTYSGVFNYLKVMDKVHSHDGRTIVEAMKATPTDDEPFGPGSVRIDGRKLSPIFKMQAKSPAESTFEWDVAKVIEVIPADKAWRPLSEGGCPLVN